MLSKLRVRLVQWRKDGARNHVVDSGKVIHSRRNALVCYRDEKKAECNLYFSVVVFVVEGSARERWEFLKMLGFF